MRCNNGIAQYEALGQLVDGGRTTSAVRPDVSATSLNSLRGTWTDPQTQRRTTAFVVTDQKMRSSNVLKSGKAIIVGL